jgi:hypothetical protein
MVCRRLLLHSIASFAVLLDAVPSQAAASSTVQVSADGATDVRGHGPGSSPGQDRGPGHDGHGHSHDACEDTADFVDGVGNDCASNVSYDCADKDIFFEIGYS